MREECLRRILGSEQAQMGGQFKSRAYHQKGTALPEGGVSKRITRPCSAEQREHEVAQALRVGLENLTRYVGVRLS